MGVWMYGFVAFTLVVAFSTMSIQAPIHMHAFMALKAATRVNAMDLCTHKCSNPQLLSVEVKLMHCGPTLYYDYLKFLPEKVHQLDFHSIDSCGFLPIHIITHRYLLNGSNADAVTHSYLVWKSSECTLDRVGRTPLLYLKFLSEKVHQLGFHHR